MPANREQDELLTAYLDGELDEALRRDVEARLASDAEARRLLDELRSAADAVRELPRSRAPDGLSEAIRTRLERRMLLGSDRPGGALAPRDSAAQSGLRIWRRLAYAALVLITAGVGFYVMEGRDEYFGEAPSKPVLELAKAPEPNEGGSDSAPAVSAFNTMEKQRDRVAQLDDETKRKLAAMGYVADEEAAPDADRTAHGPDVEYGLHVMIGGDRRETPAESDRADEVSKRLATRSGSSEPTTEAATPARKLVVANAVSPEMPLSDEPKKIETAPPVVVMQNRLDQPVVAALAPSNEPAQAEESTSGYVITLTVADAARLRSLADAVHDAAPSWLASDGDERDATVEQLGQALKRGPEIARTETHDAVELRLAASPDQLRYVLNGLVETAVANSAEVEFSSPDGRAHGLKDAIQLAAASPSASEWSDTDAPGKREQTRSKEAEHDDRRSDRATPIGAGADSLVRGGGLQDQPRVADAAEARVQDRAAGRGANASQLRKDWKTTGSAGRSTHRTRRIRSSDSAEQAKLPNADSSKPEVERMKRAAGSVGQRAASERRPLVIRIQLRPAATAASQEAVHE